VDFNGLIDKLSDFGFYETSLTGQVSGWSQTAATLFGHAEAEIVGHPSDDLMRASTGSVGSPLEDALRTGRAERFGWAARRDGSRFWANELTLPLHDAAGAATGFARVVRDITSWRAAEEERDRIFTLSPDLICVADFEGYFRRVNPSFTRVLGYAAAELTGRPFVDFVHPDDVEDTKRESGSIAKGQHDATVSFQNRYRCADGSYRWLEWKSSGSMADRLIYAVARDVTEQKAIEERMRQYAAELERSNGELQQFAYVASHDLQEPLRAVAGCVQMLAERNAGTLDAQSVELMGHAVDGAKRMQTLINDLLSYSRVGSKGISRVSTDPRASVDRAVRQLQVAIAESGATVDVGPMPSVWADPVQLTQLFQNLIGNGIKFRGDDKPIVRVEARAEAGGTLFSVRDNGIGIDPEYRERVFGIFQRLHRRKEYAGTGIGLAICRKIVERHGGRIWIESSPGGGSTFLFTIPEDNGHA
jgi:PAS domain S-box-containing protein